MSQSSRSESQPLPPASAMGPDDITALLKDAGAGKPHAGRELLPLVYRALRDLAERRMREERAAHTLQATALVHEAYLRLVGCEDLGWTSRAHFYAAAAEAMRRILIEHARRVGAKKRGGGRAREITSVADLSSPETIGCALEIEEALEALQRHDAHAASVVQLRFYTGLSIDQTAAALNVAPATIDREWRYARAWLLRYLKGDASHEENR